jgi:methyl-accepting chemotaxis protein
MKSIRSMLLAGLAIIALLFLVQAALLAWGQRNMEENVIANVQKNTIASSQLSELAVLAQQIRRYEKEYFVYVSNQERRDNYIKEWTGTSDKIAKLLQTMRANAQSAFTAEDQGKITNWISAADFYSAEMKKVFGVVNDRQAQMNAAASSSSSSATAPTKNASPASAPVLPTQYSPIEVNGMIGSGKDRLSGVLIKGVSEMSDAKTRATLALPEVTKNAFGKLWTGIMASVIVGLLIAAALAFKLPSAIAGPIRSLGEAVERMSKGDLDQAVTASGPKEFTTLTSALERMRVAQRTLMQRLRSRPA